jgi:hypothetical protein
MREMDVDNKGISQLLLSPLFLLEEILSTIMPGVVLMLLLGLKGNTLLRGVWYGSPFGYRTKIAVLLLVAYVVGAAVKLPFFLLMPFAKKAPPAEVPDWFKKQNPDIQKMITGIAIEGAIVSTPGLVDRLSVVKAGAGFHAGTGMALLVASLIPGDGSLRYLEAPVGLAMLAAAVWKSREYQNLVLQSVGIGWANLIGRMTAQQLHIAAAVIKTLGINAPVAPSPTGTVGAPAEGGPQTGAGSP